MLSLLLTTLAVLGGATPAAPVQPADELRLGLTPAVQHGKVEWFQGSYEELLATARAEQRVVLLSFYSDRCTYCARFDREAYSDREVLASLEPVLAFAVDADSEAGRRLDRQYPTEQHYPALVFLDPDGQLRDRLIGYRPVDYLLPELERILADEGTLGDLRRQAAAAPKDLDVIWALARRLDEFGDDQGYQAQVARLRELDPEGTSRPLHHLALLEALDELELSGDAASLQELLARETYPDLLFRGWNEIARHERELSILANRARQREAAAAHRVAIHRAHLNAWPHVPTDLEAWYGNHLAWEIYKDWALLDDELRERGTEIARVVVSREPGRAESLDTLACLLFSGGEVEEAVELMRTCIRLQPSKQLWRERLEMFLSRES
jgi:hypothetical protein